MPTFMIDVRLQVEAESIEHAEALADALGHTDINLDGVEPILYVDDVRPITE